MNNLRRLALITLAAAAVASSASAQTFATSDTVLRRIWTSGMDSSRTYALAQPLLDSIGPRLTGTPQQKAGNDWLVKTYASWGIEARNEAYGSWRGWRRGIPAAQLPTIFDPFVQVDRHLSGDSQQGVGLGLAISRDLARGMGGDIRVRSTVGRGTAFTLSLARG